MLQHVFQDILNGDQRNIQHLYISPYSLYSYHIPKLLISLPGEKKLYIRDRINQSITHWPSQQYSGIPRSVTGLRSWHSGRSNGRSSEPSNYCYCKHASKHTNDYQIAFARLPQADSLSSKGPIQLCFCFVFLKIQIKRLYLCRAKGKPVGSIFTRGKE